MITITSPAKEMIELALRRAKKEVLHVGLVTHRCGGKGLDLALIDKTEAKRLIDVNGVLTDISEDAEAFFDGFVFDIEGKNLKVIPPENFGPGSSCSSCNEQCEGECGCK